MNKRFKPFSGTWHQQNGTDNYAWIIESRDNGKIKALIYSQFTGRATIGFIQNWFPLPRPVEYEDVPPNVIDTIQNKRKALLIQKWEAMQ